jgi:hypothetical protein
VSRITYLTRLFNQQNGLCWICGLPMHQPRQGLQHEPPHAYAPTIDHLEPKRLEMSPSIGISNKPQPKFLFRLEGKGRPTKAAHRICNNLRAHKPLDHPKIQNHIKMMHLKFARSSLSDLGFDDSNRKTGPEEEGQSTNSEPAPSTSAYPGANRDR